MANVVVDSQDVVAPWRSKLQILWIALGAGAAWWVVTSLLAQYVIEPLACRSTDTLTACGDAPIISGSVAAVIVSAASLFALVTIRQPRPLIVAVGSVATLWLLGLYVSGLVWYEALLWAMAAYAVTFVLFSTIGYIRRFWVSLVVAIIVVVTVRLLTAF